MNISDTPSPSNLSYHSSPIQAHSIFHSLTHKLSILLLNWINVAVLVPAVPRNESQDLCCSLPLKL